MEKSLSKNKKNREAKNERAFFAFLSPWLIGFLLFTLIPMAFSLFFSFNKVSVNNLEGLKWVGLDNFSLILRGDSVFWVALRNTFIFAALRVGVGVIIAILVALLLNHNFRLKRLLRTLIFIPALLPIVGSAIVWRQLFSNDFSLFNYLLNFIGISPVSWMSWNNAMGSILLMSIWCGIGPTMIIIHASLQNVPQSLVEAAEIDGANSFVKFKNITLPMISPTIFYIVITGIIGALQAFVEMQLLNGNSESTTTLTMQVMSNVFSGFGLGYASAMSWIIFVIVGVLTAIFFKVINRAVYYENKVD